MAVAEASSRARFSPTEAAARLEKEFGMAANAARGVATVLDDLLTGELVRTSDLEAAEARLRESDAATRAELKVEIADLRTELKTEIADLRAELKTEIADLRTELKTEIADLRTELKTEIADLRAEMAKRENRMISLLIAAIVVATAVAELIPG